MYLNKQARAKDLLRKGLTLTYDVFKFSKRAFKVCTFFSLSLTYDVFKS